VQWGFWSLSPFSIKHASKSAMDEASNTAAIDLLLTMDMCRGLCGSLVQVSGSAVVALGQLGLTRLLHFAAAWHPRQRRL